MDIDCEVTKICNLCSFDMDKLRSKSRHRDIKVARFTIMYLLKKKYTLKEIGIYFLKDHSTVHSAIEKVKIWITTSGYEKENKILKSIIDKINQSE